MTLAERKLVELDSKLAGINREFSRWLADAGAERPLRKHNSQLVRVTDTLRGLVDRIAAERVLITADHHDLLGECHRLQQGMLEVYRIWEFFRSKLALRYQQDYARFLAVADEYAWACYEPTMLCAAEFTRPGVMGSEPPLVHLSGGFSPFAHLRGTPFEVEEPFGALNSIEFLQVVVSLPVPVVGLPWYQMNHLPDLVLLAHEVGHCVEQDLHLNRTVEGHLAARMADIPADRRQCWYDWASELFADCFAALVAGPAYLTALSDFLALGSAVPDPVSVECRESPNPAASVPPHPPAFLRAALVAKVLDHLGFDAESAAYRDSWSMVDDPLLADVDLVVDALLSGCYPQFTDRRLTDLPRFSAKQQRDAENAAVSVLDGRRPRTVDVRSLLAGARFAFNRAPSSLEEWQGVVLAQALKSVDDKTRGTRTPTSSEHLDRAAGVALFDLITRQQNRGANR